jgi:hypothetical protein
MDYLKNPFDFASLMAADMPILLIVFNAAADTFKVIHLSSSGI